MPQLATSRNQDLAEDAAALTQYAIDLTRAQHEGVAATVRVHDRGRALWVSVMKRWPELRCLETPRLHEDVEAAMVAAEKLSRMANAPR